MKAEYFSHKNVRADGSVKGGGGVEVSGGIRASPPGGGCDLPKCSCGKGHWICYVRPRTKDGVVEGVTLKFESGAALKQFKKENDLTRKDLPLLFALFDGILESAAGRTN